MRVCAKNCTEMADLALTILLRVQDAASGAMGTIMKSFNSKLQELGPGAQIAAGAALGVSAAVIGIGVASAKMAADYQQNMNMVQALTGSSQNQMASYDSQLKALSMDAGVAPTQLAQGLYQVISAGYAGSQAMKVLTLSTEDSKIGMTDAATTADSLTNILKSFAWQTKDATQVNGIMLETVTLGKSTFQQYASTITKASSVAAQFHISLQTMSAAWATMTSNGVKAKQASTDFVQVVQAMYGKVGTITKSLQKNGIAFNETAFNAANFQGKVQMLNAALQEASKKHVQITGVTLQAAQALTILSQHSKDYQNDLATMSSKQAMAKKTQEAWAITQNGFNQSMSRLSATVQVLMINIGSALLPVITNLVNWVSKGITSFVSWWQHSKELQSILHSLGTGFSMLGDILGKVGNWFSQNAAAMTALKIVGIAIGGAVLGLLVAGFVSLAIAAGSAAVAVIMATWPFLLIGAGIALLIGLIILLVTHWKQLTSWVGTQMSRFGGFVHGIFSSIGSAIGNFFSGLGTKVHGFFSAIGTAFGNFFSMLGTIVHKGLMELVALFLSPFTGIINLFKWLYAHNTYFKKLIDTIKHIISIGLNWLRDQWNRFTGWLGGLWSGLKNKAGQAWGAVSSAIGSKVSGATSWLKGAWTTSGNWLANKWAGLKDNMSKAWSAVSGVIGGAWNTYIVKPLQNLWQMFLNFVNGWPKQAMQWGINLIQGLINGITSMIGNVGKAVGNIAHNIASFLGFHSPTKEGPGSQSNTWAPNLVKMFTSGLAAGQPKVQAALNTMINPLAKVMHTTTSAVTPVRSSSGYVAAGGGQGGHTFNITVNGMVGANKKEIVDYLDKELGRRMMRNTNLVTQRSGGRSS